MIIKDILGYLTQDKILATINITLFISIPYLLTYLHHIIHESYII